MSQLLADSSNGEARNILIQNYTVMQEDCYRSIVLIPFWYGPIATAVFAFIFGGIVFLFGATIFIAFCSKRFGWSQNSKPYLVVVGGLIAVANSPHLHHWCVWTDSIALQLLAGSGNIL